jgi:hypothetical protein
MKLWTKIKGYLTLKLLVSTIIGISGGYAYYYFIGCSSGTCAITSNPINSMVWGGLMGLAFGWPSEKPVKKEEQRRAE